MRRAEALNLLGVASDASAEDIKKAYRKLAMKHHPDRGGEEVQFKKIKEAFEFLESGKPDEVHGTSGFNQHGFGPGFTSYQATAEQVSDLLNKFRNFSGHPSEHGWSDFSAKSSMEVRIAITAKEALAGCTKVVKIDNGGDGLNAAVTFPAGCTERTSIDIITSKDAKFIIYAKITDDRYTIDWGVNDANRRGDVKTDLFISPFKMILGGWQEATMLDGSVVSVRVPPGLESNRVLKVKGQGYWRNEKCADRGDCFLRAIPAIKKLDEYPQEELKEIEYAIHTKINPGAGASGS